MHEIVDQITSPGWWFSVVVVGAIFAVLGPFLNDWIRSVVAGFSERRAELQRKRLTERDVLVASLATGTRALCIFLFEAGMEGLLAVSLFGLGCLMPMIAFVFESPALQTGTPLDVRWIPPSWAAYEALVLMFASYVPTYRLGRKLGVLRRVKDLVRVNNLQASLPKPPD